MSRRSETGATAPGRRLDVQQEAAAAFGIVGPGDHVGGPLLILAGAGSGKTTTLVARIERLVAAGCDPGRILALTFSRRAASELSTRSRVAVPGMPKSCVGTFHSIAVQVLRTHHHRLGLDPDFAILDRADAIDVMTMVREDMPTIASEPPLPPPAACLDILSATTNGIVPLREILAQADGDLTGIEGRLAALFDRYREAKALEHSLDFDDLLSVLDGALADRTFAANVAGTWDHILVDEYQDTNPLQFSILHRLRPGGRGLTVVGDDAQAIYGFRGASTDGIHRFADAFDPPATVLRLETSYRCTTQILELASAILRDSGCLPRSMRGVRDGDAPRILSVEDETEQARLVVDETVAFVGAGGDPGSRAILYRSSYQSSAIEIELVGHRIPYVKRGGARWSDSAHVRDFLSILRFAITPAARTAGFRCLRLLPGVGPAIASRILEALDGGPMDDLDPVVQGKLVIDVPDLSGFRTGLATIAASASPAWACYVALDLYRPLAERRYVDAEDRLADLEPLLAASTSRSDLREWLDDLTLDPIAPGDPAGSSGMITLSTIHAAKGLEWDEITLLSCTEGSIPSVHAKTHAELEEERRILYVAVTRAASSLTMMMPRWRSSGGPRRPRKPSRFLPTR